MGALYSRFIAIVIILGWGLAVPSMGQNNSAVTPANLFNAGYNLGLLVDASGQGVQAATYPVWAANATAEWSAAWEPVPVGFEYPLLSGSYPFDAVYRYESQLENTMQYSALCKDPLLKANPWAKNAIWVYRAGFYFGKVNVITATDCLECLTGPLVQLASDLESLGKATENAMIKEYASNLMEIAFGIRITNSRAEDIAVLQSLRAVILEENFEPLMDELPLIPQPCGPLGAVGTGSPATIEMKFSSTYGELDFEKKADGTYRSNYGKSEKKKLIVKYDGKFIVGFWLHEGTRKYCDEAFEGSQYWGKVSFVWNLETQRFEGLWGYCDAKPTKNWDIWE